MSRPYQIRSVAPCFLLTAFALVLGGRAVGGPDDPPTRGVGEVTGNDVYVRSGGSLNHYPVCKLKAGDRVTIVSERGNWYEILPPEGVFSLISGEYVDTVDNKDGVVNGNNVRVRAGSLLNNNKYTVQTMLSKGAEVEIVGESPDGFLRIKPPKGATLWVTCDYVELVPDELIKLERETGAPIEMKEAEPEGPDQVADKAAQDRAMAEVEATPSSPLEVVPPTPQRKELEQIDTVTRAELARPILERQLEPLAQRYRAIAEQDQDGFARRYARKRLEQISNMLALTNTIRRMRTLDERAESLRREHRSARAEMYEVMPPAPVGLDARGELRVSAAYPGGSTPRLYRLVDPGTPNGRTVGYVEVPSGSTLKVEDFLGRYVGVRASKKRLLTGGVDPVPIYVVSEIVPLASPAAKSETPLDED